MKSLLRILRKVFFIDLLKGMVVTQKYFALKKITVQYPKQRIDVRARAEYDPGKERYMPGTGRFRGLLRLVKDPVTGEELCTGCGLCQRICPDGCIEVAGEKKKEGKGRRHQSFKLDLQRCMFCDLCVEVCPTGAIVSTNDYELAAYGKNDFVFEIETLYGRPEIVTYRK